MFFLFLVIFIGFFSVFSQSVFLRELLITFYGNELSAGVLLSSWLFFGGIGSFLFTHFSSKIKENFFLFFLLLEFFSLLGLVEIFLIRNLRIFLRLYPGEIVSPKMMFSSSLLILAPFSLVNGFLFPFSIRLYSAIKRDNSVGKIYACDALGDMLGGLTFSFLFVYLFSAFKNLYFVSFALILIVLIFSLLMREKTEAKATSFQNKVGSIDLDKDSPKTFLFKKRKYLTYGVRMISFILIILFLIIGLKANKIERFLLSREWKGFYVVDKASSVYADLILTKSDSLYSLFENGILSSTFPLRIHSEEIVHFTFLQKKDIRRVMVIGGGVSGILYEILKYPVEEVYYLELDPKLIELVKKYLPFQDKAALNSPRVKVINREVRNFLNLYRGKKFDVILLNTPLPLTLYLNRFYTWEFFKRIKFLLNPGGVFSFSLPSKESYLSKELRDLQGCLYHTLKKVFSNIIIIPGEKARFIVSDSPLIDSPETLSSRFEKMNISARYFNEYYIFSRLIPWHLNYIKDILTHHKQVKINYDFEPIAYFYGISYFTSHFGSWWDKLFSSLSKINFSFYLIFWLVLMFVFYFFRRNWLFALAMFNIGFGGLSSVFIFIVGFQIIYGYVYHKVGLITALFMLGLALGANFFSFLKKEKVVSVSLVSICFVCGVFFVFTPLILKFFSCFPSLNYQFFFFTFPFSFGFLGGSFFSLVNQMYSKNRESYSRAGILYGLDLAGGSLGGISISIVFFPLYGIIKSCNFIGVLLIATAIFLFLALKSK